MVRKTFKKLNTSIYKNTQENRTDRLFVNLIKMYLVPCLVGKHFQNPE